eukprot:m.1247614 g.1247614  ORF g.1247614 m.1247614 type:complete len:459 (+) comp24692_c0_seq3:355-1731(+)
MEVSRRLLSSVVSSTFASAGYQQGDVLSLQCTVDGGKPILGGDSQSERTSDKSMEVDVVADESKSTGECHMDISEDLDVTNTAFPGDAKSIDNHMNSEVRTSTGSGRIQVIYSDVCMEAFRETENYLARILRRAKGLAELQGRTEITALDTVLSIQQLGTPFADTVAHLRAFKRRRTETPCPLPPVDRQPASLEDEAKTTDFLRGECLLYDESHRQLRPSHVPSYLPQFPEPHSYMRTPVYYPPTTSFLEWRRKQVAHTTGLQIALSNMAAASTQPTPGHIEIDSTKKCTLPLLTRPRKSTSWLAAHTTALDRAPKQATVANVIHNPYFQPEKVEHFPLSWVKARKAAPAAAQKATPATPLGTLRLDTVPIPLNVNEITITVNTTTGKQAPPAGTSTAPIDPGAPLDEPMSGAGSVGSISVRAVDRAESNDVDMADVGAAAPGALKITLTPGEAPPTA